MTNILKVGYMTTDLSVAGQGTQLISFQPVVDLIWEAIP